MRELRSATEHPWTQQNRARIGFAMFPLSAPPEPLSGSMRNYKSRAHAGISGDSPRCPKTDGLNGGGESFSFSGKYFHIDNTRFIPTPVQQPRIPIWVAGTWPNRPPFRRAARYDGVIPVAGDVRSALSTAQVEELTAYVRQCRGEVDTPCEVVYSATTPASGHPDKEIVAAFADAGATWWLETMLPAQWPPERARDRIRRGPPG